MDWPTIEYPTPYQGGCGCKNYDATAGKCSLAERPFNGDWQDVPQAIIDANNNFVESAGPLASICCMSPVVWPSCEETLTFCRRWTAPPCNLPQHLGVTR